MLEVYSKALPFLHMFATRECISSAQAEPFKSTTCAVFQPFTSTNCQYIYLCQIFVPDEVEDLAIARIVCLLLLYLWEGKSKSADASSSCYRIVLALEHQQYIPATLRRTMSSRSLFQLEVFADRPPNIVFRFSIVHSTLALSVQLWFQGHPATATAVCELGWAPAF